MQPQSLEIYPQKRPKKRKKKHFLPCDLCFFSFPEPEKASPGRRISLPQKDRMSGNPAEKADPGPRPGSCSGIRGFRSRQRCGRIFCLGVLPHRGIRAPPYSSTRCGESQRRPAKTSVRLTRARQTGRESSPAGKVYTGREPNWNTSSSCSFTGLMKQCDRVWLSIKRTRQ